MRDLAAGVGVLVLIAGLVTLWGGGGALGLGLVAIGAVVVLGALRSRP